MDRQRGVMREKKKKGICRTNDVSREEDGRKDERRSKGRRDE